MSADTVPQESKLERFILSSFFLYATGFFLLLLISVWDTPKDRTIIAMGLSLLIVWVLIGGLLQRFALQRFLPLLVAPSKSPILRFGIFATILACLEEAIAVTITNLAPLYGVSIGEAYITASSNYFTVIFFHSVIAFIPMFFVLGYFLKKYAISPFATLLFFGCIGVFAEISFAGPMTALNSPFWILVYGLMVFLPAHGFTALERKKLPFYLYPLLIPVILFAAIATAWIPAVLDIPRIHFEAGN